eukprot:TRINITY_DN373_c0_g1_i4.p1 TRINITY_DN373_c0_g1~~TRINITY_DN373_c0_g1_i4.p1  ORF type:complete len:346 (+),score=61.67 TRINITY_DN373_c0_g1_i4:1-1038(+)
MNLGFSTVGHSRPSWLDQKSSWKCESNTCTASSCGGWTQVIWATSTRMGCAVSRCGNQENSLCLYSPSGNVNGRHPFGTETWRCAPTSSPVILPTPTVVPPSPVILPTPTVVPHSPVMPPTVVSPSPVTPPTVVSPSPVTPPTVVPPSPVTPPTGTSNVDKTVWIDPQNAARAAYGLPPFIYDDILAQLAQQHTSKCVSTFPDRNELASSYAALTTVTTSFGMNLGFSTVGHSRPSWLDQKSSWKCESNTCTASSCGGWTQVIWATSTRMGCAVSRCGNRENSLCLYSPSGNVNGRHPFGTETWRCTSPNPTTSFVSTESEVSHHGRARGGARSRGRGRGRTSYF